MTESTGNIFENYKRAVEGLVVALSKTQAIELSIHPSKGMISPASIKKLYKSLSCDGWKNQVGTNWIWRTEVGNAAPKNSSKEVLLERAVAGQDLEKWTYQMSTSSGVQIVQGKTRKINLFSRKSIDLVRFIKSRHYAFVELKVGSNNPLYAAFEILGYALAYLHARTNAWSGAGEHDVFDAEKIELTILGPKNWHMYGENIEYKLDWLAEQIAASLNDFVKSEFKNKLIFSMKFRQFPEGDLDSTEDIEQRAIEVNRLAAREWWKC